MVRMKYGKWSLYAVWILLIGAFAVIPLMATLTWPLSARQVVLTGRQTPIGYGQGSPVYYRSQVLVLMYHNVSPSVSGHGTITPQRFAADIAELQQQGYHFISAESFAAFLDGREPVPANAVLLTFDDGYRGFYYYVFPVLAQNRVPAAVFIIIGQIGKRHDLLTWPQVKSLDQSNLVTVAAHTFNLHYNAASGPKDTAPATVALLYDRRMAGRESRSAYEQRLIVDCRRAQETLQLRLGHSTPFFAYPYGAYNPELVRILNRAGYRYLFTVLCGANRQGQDPLHILRINAGVPWLSSSGLLIKIRSTAVLSKFQKPPPSAWIP